MSDPKSHQLRLDTALISHQASILTESRIQWCPYEMEAYCLVSVEIKKPLPNAPWTEAWAGSKMCVAWF